MLLLLQKVHYPFNHIYELPTMFVSSPVRLLKAVKSETVLVLLCTLILEKINCKSWFKKVLIFLESSWQFKNELREGIRRKKEQNTSKAHQTTSESISWKLTLPDKFCRDCKFYLMHIIGGPENQEVILINKADVCLHFSPITYAKSCIGNGTDKQWLISPAQFNKYNCMYHVVLVWKTDIL